MSDTTTHNPKTYLGHPLYRPKVAFFEFASCEGCQLQVVNNERTLLDFLSLVEVVNFREAMTERSDDYEIAFIEGSIGRAEDATRLKGIRKKAKLLVAFGSCACFGGVNRLRNRFDDHMFPVHEVYGNHRIDSSLVRSVKEVVHVDLEIPGCPVSKTELERIVLHLALGKSLPDQKHSICIECKAKSNVCLFDLGESCIGPVTKGGCDAWCPSNRYGCSGCRGPAEDMNIPSLEQIMASRGFSREELIDRLECFGGFAVQVDALKISAPAKASMPAPKVVRKAKVALKKAAKAAPVKKPIDAPKSKTQSKRRAIR